MELIDSISSDIEGTTTSLSSILYKYDIDADEDELEDWLEYNISICKGCGWWFENCMLDGQYPKDEEPEDYDVDEHIGYCPECIEDRL